jgi:hypothetical protein
MRNALALLGLSFTMTFALYNGVLTVHLSQVAWYPQAGGCRGVGFGPSELITPGGTFRFGATVTETLWVENLAALPCRVSNLSLALGGAWTVRSSSVPLTVLPGQTAAITITFDAPSHPFDQSAVVEYDTTLWSGPAHLVSEPCAGASAGPCGLAAPSPSHG